MKTIELEKWVTSKEDPRKLKYAGQPRALDVFQELKYRLESMGYLPDEYFLLDQGWFGGREVPRDADIFCSADYGRSEGVYLNVYLKWYENGKSITETFATGKTLGESGSDLDRMFLIASAITKAFHGEGTTYARYMAASRTGEDIEGSVIYLSKNEQDVLLNALVEQQEFHHGILSQTEQLLRRMTGSITAYMDLVGRKPLAMRDYDRAVLAIRDGELETFKELLKHDPELEDRGSFLIEAAARPGEVGRKMLILVLAEPTKFSEAVYWNACQKAVDIADAEKVALLQEQAPEYVENLSVDFFGRLAQYAAQQTLNFDIAKQICERCGLEQTEAEPEDPMEEQAEDQDEHHPSEPVQEQSM